MAPSLLSALLGRFYGTTYRIDTELEIAAAPQQVWAVFGDFARWGDWNDFMELGPAVPEKVGGTCRVLFHLEGGCMKTSKHEPEVSEVF